jgi:uncharacterized integral membrane protein
VSKLSWIITIPVVVVCVVFSIFNQQPVTIDLWPFALTYTLPLYLMVLLLLLFGFLIGAAVMWISAGRLRDKARRNYYKASDLEREVTWLKRKQAQSDERERAQGREAGRAGRVPVSGSLPGTPERG